MTLMPLVLHFSYFHWVYALLFLLIPHSINALHDLEAKVSPFFVSSKQISIEGYPTAFNPSIVRWQDKILLSFRIRDPLTKSTHQIGLIWLDEDFSPISAPQTLTLPSPTLIPRSQDPRLIVIDDRLWMAFNDVCVLDLGSENRRMAYSELLLDEEGQWSASAPTYLLDFEGCLPKRQEKNWVPFDYEGHLLFSYSISPHQVLYPPVGSGYCETISLAENKIAWNWGVLRGGSGALKVDGHYLAFFHSVKDLTTLQSEGKRMDHYFMGAYTFSTIPPPFKLPRLVLSQYGGKIFTTVPSTTHGNP